MVAFTVNGQRKELGVDGDTPLLWVLREHLKMTGTKFGCGVAACGACTVLVGGVATRSCAVPISLLGERAVSGYCQSGQIMQAAALLARNKNPSREQIVEHMDGNLCRCGTYLRIISAIQRAAREG